MIPHIASEKASQSKIFMIIYCPLLSYFIGPRLKQMLESSLKLSVCKPKLKTMRFIYWEAIVVSL